MNEIVPVSSIEQTKIASESMVTKAAPFTIPGAFGDRPIVLPSALPQPFEPLSIDEVRSALAFTATISHGTSYDATSLPEFVRNTSLRLAELDDSGRCIRELEEHIISYTKDEFYSRLPDYFRTIGVRTHSYADRWAIALPGPVAASAPQAIAASALKLGDQPSALAEAADPDTATGSNTSIQVSQLSANQLLTYAKDLISRVYENIESKTFAGDELHDEVSHAAQLSRALIADPEAAQMQLRFLSPRQRFAIALEELATLNEALSDSKQQMAQIADAEHKYRFGPQIFLAAQHGDILYQVEDAAKVAPKGWSPADEHAMATHTFLRLSSSGIKVEYIRYDRQWGAVSNSNSDVLSEIVRDGINSVLNEKKDGQEPYQLQKLVRVINGFLYIPKDAQNSMVEALKSEDMTTYLANSDNWLGKQILPPKSWLGADIEAKNPEFVLFLRDATDRLANGRSQSDTLAVDDPRFERFPRMLMSSLLLNTQAEGLLSRFITTSLTTGVALKDLVLGTIAERSGAAYLNSLESNESLLLSRDIFNPLEDGGLQLREFGANYLIQLVDPSFSVHVTGGDSRELQQRGFEERRRWGY